MTSNKFFITIFIFITFIFTKENKPNFIIIFVDDMGYNDIESFGIKEGKKIKTPHLKKLASEGIKMNDFYVPPVCSPSRASLLTGRYSTVVKVDTILNKNKKKSKKGINYVFRTNGKNGLSPDEITIAEMLKTVGYKTALFGKWHLGHKKIFLPNNQGFDEFYGLPYSNDMGLIIGQICFSKTNLYRENYSSQRIKKLYKQKKKKQKRGILMYNDKIIEYPLDQTTITKRLTERTVDYIKKNKNNPFLVYLSHPMPHTPLYVSEDFKGKSEGGLYGDVIEEIDWSVGQVMKAVKESNIEENTFIIFTSDNGPWLIRKKNGGTALPLRNGKGSAYEGGTRVPTIIKYPRKIKAGTEFNKMTTIMDVFPTVIDLANVKTKYKNIHGYSLIKTIKKNKSPYDSFLYQNPKGEYSAIRKDNWKLVFHNPYTGYSRQVDKEFEGIELYNLKKDIGEKNNLSKKYPKLVKSLRKEATDKINKLANQ